MLFFDLRWSEEPLFTSHFALLLPTFWNLSTSQGTSNESLMIDEKSCCKMYVRPSRWGQVPVRNDDGGKSNYGGAISNELLDASQNCLQRCFVNKVSAMVLTLLVHKCMYMFHSNSWQHSLSSPHNVHPLTESHPRYRPITGWTSEPRLMRVTKKHREASRYDLHL